MSGFGDWMVDTFVYTSLLIALVLLIRRPVTRHFGPQVAYALWALPFLRFIMPPIVLPAWMAPAEPVAPVASTANEPLMVIISDPGTPVAATAEPAMLANEAMAAAPVVGIAVTDLLLPLWLGGALLFVGWRIREYRRMRAGLLEEAIPVGEAGKVRLVETPAVTGPVAFGVFDKVVALPPAFMARHDINARDMAIAHELAHHRGNDLVANMAAQPLLALHWFNPLAWWGWRAMRRDQEAACDARVVAGRARSERVTYAQVIAGYATGDDLALAAPMACPVLGEKSIIHRLRNLTMSDISSRRRRFGIAAITTTALALPLTASITYAQAEAPLAPEAPIAPEAPFAPSPPQPPVAPMPPQEITTVDPDGEADGERRVIVRMHADDGDGEHRVIHRRIIRNGEELSEEERAELMATIEEEMGQLEIRMEGIGEEIERTIELAFDETSHENRWVGEDGVEIEMSCDGGDENGVTTRELSDGRQAVIICRSRLHRLALTSAEDGLHAALVTMRTMEGVSVEEREEAIREMEAAIEELREEIREQREDDQAFLQPRAKPVRDALRSAPRRGNVAARWMGRMVSPIAPLPANVRLRFNADAPSQAPAAPAHATSNADCESEVPTRA